MRKRLHKSWLGSVDLPRQMGERPWRQQVPPGRAVLGELRKQVSRLEESIRVGAQTSASEAMT